AANPYTVVTLRDQAAPGLPAPTPLNCFFTQAQVGCTQYNPKHESRRSAYGEQAGAEHSGHLPEYSSQRQNPNYDLSGQRRQAYREDPLLRQVLRASRKQQPGAVDLQARHFDRSEQPKRDA